MTSKAKRVVSKAQQLINRFPFTDLAIAISRSGSRRRGFIENFVSGSSARSYTPFRKALLMIYGAEMPLLTPERETWANIESFIRKEAKAIELEMNLDVARLLRELISTRNLKAYTLDEQPLRIGHNQIAPIGLRFYCVEDAQLIFQFPQPRVAPTVEENVAIAMMSMIHHAYAFGDYSSARIELADLSAIERNGDRMPRFRKLDPSDLIARDKLGERIDEVYALLHELAEKRFAPRP